MIFRFEIVEKKEPREVTTRYGGIAEVCDLVGEDKKGIEHRLLFGMKK